MAPKSFGKRFGFAELHGGESRVVLIPELGGKMSEMELAGRQWLWTSDVIPYETPVDGASYVKTADTGGFDECFPTVGPCSLPSAAGGFSGLTLPDHGELWAQRPAFTMETGDYGQRATCTWRGRRMPYRFLRQVEVDATGAVVTRYEVTNEGSEKLPFIWSSHPLLPLTPHTRIVLPEGARTRVYAQHHIDLRGAGAEHRWPKLRTSTNVVDFSHPDAVGRQYACKLFLDVPSTPRVATRAAVVEGDRRLEVEFDAGAVPNFGLWINRRGWTPFRWRRRYLNFAFEPCIGAPDTLSDALGAWQSAHWLEGGDTRRWSLTWRGRTASAA